jgi:hypothetical protein
MAVHNDTAIIKQSFTFGSPELEIFLGVRANCCQKHSEHPFEFKSFAGFVADIGRMPSPDHTLETIDEARGYTPGNCRWIAAQILAAVLFLVLTLASGSAAFAGPKPSDFPLRATVEEKTRTLSVDSGSYQLGHCYGDVCSSGHEIHDLQNETAVQIGDRYYSVASRTAFNPGVYLARITGKNKLELLGRDMKGEFHVNKCRIVLITGPGSKVERP